MTDGKTRWLGWLATAALVAGATALGVVGGGHLAAPDVVMLYVLAIGVASSIFDRRLSLVASALSVLAYDFFFVAPVHTLAIDEERNLLTFAMLFVVGLAVNGLTLRIRNQAGQARLREERTAVLYSLSRDLGAAKDATDIARLTAQHAAQAFHCDAAVLFPDDAGVVAVQAVSRPAFQLQPEERAAAQLAFERVRVTGNGSDLVPSDRICCAPLASGVDALGVLLIAGPSVAGLGGGERDFLEAFARQSALACARAQFAEEARSQALRARTEETRSSLLSAVSHDLRTPLAAITGAGTALRAEHGSLSPAQRNDLLDTVCEEAVRLDRLVRNLLDMTRIQSGAIEVKRDWVPIEEVVGSALARVDEQLAGRPVRTELAADLPLVSIDPVLIEVALVNLLENAVKHTPAGSSVEVAARAEGDALVIEVADSGPGLPAGAEARLFDKFFRASQTGASGAGLGLAICRGIVEAHGGTIAAANRPTGGASFRIRLPTIGTPPEVAADEEELEAPEGRVRP